MGFYATTIFPRLCDLVLGRPSVARHRRELLATACGEILEIGFGTGLNLPHYPAGVRKVTAVDPSPAMHRLARARIKQAGIVVDYRPLGGESLPFGESTFDTVACTFTLCSIDEVNRAMSEVYRVLRPGGRFLFLEHGLSPDAGVRRWQRRLNGLEMRLAEGCRLDRDIAGLVAGQPFASMQVQNYYLEQTPWTHGYLYSGSAVR